MRFPTEMAEFHIGLTTVVVSLSILAFPKEMTGLKLLGVEVPRVVTRGDSTPLRCDFDLEEDTLYSVLWYKDHEEFYRYVPRNEPKQHSYLLDGFQVATRESNDHVVILKNVTLKATGVYRCEVSAEAPSFTSVHGEGQMDVIAPPNEDPEITGEEKLFRIGDILSLNCTSGKSYPSARLKWFVNGQQADSDYEAVLQNHGLFSSISGLNLKILPHHFKEGQISVRCVSTIYKSATSPTDNNNNNDTKRELPIDRREALFQVEGKGANPAISKWLIIPAITIFLT